MRKISIVFIAFVLMIFFSISQANALIIKNASQHIILYLKAALLKQENQLVKSQAKVRKKIKEAIGSSGQLKSGTKAIDQIATAQGVLEILPDLSHIPLALMANTTLENVPVRSYAAFVDPPENATIEQIQKNREDVLENAAVQCYAKALLVRDKTDKLEGQAVSNLEVAFESDTMRHMQMASNGQALQALKISAMANALEVCRLELLVTQSMNKEVLSQ